jgi:hypothetical protein
LQALQIVPIVPDLFVAKLSNRNTLVNYPPRFWPVIQGLCFVHALIT